MISGHRRAAGGKRRTQSGLQDSGTRLVVRQKSGLWFGVTGSHDFFALILTRTKAMTAPVAIVNFMQFKGWKRGKIAAAGTLMLSVLGFTFSCAASRPRANGRRRQRMNARGCSCSSIFQQYRKPTRPADEAVDGATLFDDLVLCESLKARRGRSECWKSAKET